ncbi:MAG: hypothetical protein GY737_11435 [Desulfobacteraceae bacterium]|nr:hypothetical protein [Desulfobacteraceae bacterium]
MISFRKICFNFFLPFLCIMTLAFSYYVHKAGKSGVDGCSSWVTVGGNALYGDRTILHKNRDEDAAKLSEMRIRCVDNSQHDGQYTYLAVTDNKSENSLHVFGGVNEMGLAVSNNFVMGTVWTGPYIGPEATRELLENAADAEEAYEWIAANPSSKFTNGNIIFVADKDKAYVVEVKQRYNFLGLPNGIKVTSRSQSLVNGIDQMQDVSQYDDEPVIIPAGVRFRSNHYKMFGNLWIFNADSDDSVGRYNTMGNILTRTPQEALYGIYGEIDIFNSNDASKSHAQDPGVDYPICKHAATGIRTLAGITIEIDPDTPLNSDLYCAFGNPCSAPYIKYSLPGNDENTIYDYEDVIIQDEDRNIFFSEVALFPFNGSASDRISFFESTDYDGVMARDGVYMASGVPAPDNKVVVWNEMTLDATVTALEDIYQLEFLYSAQGASNGVGIWVKRVDSDWWSRAAWTQVGTEGSPDSAGNLKRIMLDTTGEGFAPYIDQDGMITWVVATTSGQGDAVALDYSGLVVVPKR